jgi:hypothetical protein
VIIIFTTAAVLFLSGCSGGGGSSSAPGSDVVNETGGTTDGSGVSGNEQIEVENGNIVVNPVDGVLAIDGIDLQLVVQDENGSWVLAEDVTVSVYNNSGEAVSGEVAVDPETGVITFVPEDPLDVSETYTISVTAGDSVHETTIIIAVDDTGSGDESMFASVPLYSTGSYSLGMNELIVNGKAILGWEFGESPERFTVKLENIEEGAEVFLTAYGTYNIPGHESEVYYQKWASTGELFNEGEPVKDFKWSGFTIRVDESDYTLDSADNDYSFWSTYLELRIIRDGEDITALSGAVLKVN